MSTIAINCRSILKSQHTGIGRYAYNLIKSLTEIDQKNRYQLYAPKGLFDWSKKVPVFSGKNISVQYDWRKKGPEHIVGGADIYHVPHPDVVRPMKAKVIVTIHDLVYRAFAQGHTEETLRLTDEQIKSFIPHVSKIICVSENTRRDVHRYFDVEESKTCVVYHGVDKARFHPLNDAQKFEARHRLESLGIKDPFILFVGTIEARKNLIGLLRAFAAFRKKSFSKGKLVITGMKGWKTEDLDAELGKLNIRQDVLILGFLEDTALRDLYNCCEIFVFPSFYEGFGYPILEALACGAPVICSTAASCPEVAGDTAVMVNPEDPEDIAYAMNHILQDDKLRADLRQKGPARAEEFDFEKTARETLDVYQEVLNQ